MASTKEEHQKYLEQLDSEYYDVKMSVDEIWQVLELWYKTDNRQEIQRLSNIHGGLTKHLLEIAQAHS